MGGDPAGLPQWGSIRPGWQGRAVGGWLLVWGEEGGQPGGGTAEDWDGGATGTLIGLVGHRSVCHSEWSFWRLVTWLLYM